MCIRDRYGQYFIVPDIELGTYWTNTSLPDETVIDLYHAHGESEQYHSEIKTDMDVERLPSGKFESNKLVLELTMIAYNPSNHRAGIAEKEGCSRPEENTSPKNTYGDQ